MEPHLEKPIEPHTEPHTEITMSAQTNWNIAAGSIDKCVTFQSSSSLFDDDADEIEATAVDSTPKSPLVLHLPSSDHGPCEIKINFAEKHELRQVYVRGTARVYEIYYAPNLHSTDEYLCTVRCGIAARDGEVLCAPNVQEITSSHIEDSNKELGEENIKNGDDWVEVKVIDTPVLDGINSEKSSQDLFEATAEITDANPCISVTLRLLSLQTKGCIYIDEIYVFGDHVASADSESQESRNENSSGSSLMSMFLPTLLQLSKTTGLGHLNTGRKEKQYYLMDNLEEIHQSDSVIKTQLKGDSSITDSQEVKEVNGDRVGLSQPDRHSKATKMESDHTAVPSRSNHDVVPSIENNHSDVPLECNHNAIPNHGCSFGGSVTMALEQLLSRMDRIEEICLGFQEKMVSPMSNIESRIQRVEQQLETLTEKLQNSGLPSSSRISAPDDSCIELDANCHGSCCGYTAVTGEIESDNKDLHLEVPVSHDMSDSAKATQMLPGLVVTAPEFPEGEDEDEDNASRQDIVFSNDDGKQNSSIDVALSSALADFLASLSLESPKYTRSLMLKAPEFSNEDDDDHDDIHSLALEAKEYGQFCSEKGDQYEEGVKAHSIADRHDNSRTGFNKRVEDEENRKINDHCRDQKIEDEEKIQINDRGSNDSSSDIFDSSNESSDNQGGPSTRTDVTIAAEVPNKASYEDIVKSVLGFALSSSAVDFEFPLLDVKFTTERSPISDPFLEALLVDMPGTNSQDPLETTSQDPYVMESSDLKSNADLSVDEHYNLVAVEDGELETPASVDKGDNLPQD